MTNWQYFYHLFESGLSRFYLIRAVDQFRVEQLICCQKCQANDCRAIEFWAVHPHSLPIQKFGQLHYLNFQVCSAKLKYLWGFCDQRPANFDARKSPTSEETEESLRWHRRDRHRPEVRRHQIQILQRSRDRRMGLLWSVQIKLNFHFQKIF